MLTGILIGVVVMLVIIALFAIRLALKFYEELADAGRDASLDRDRELRRQHELALIEASAQAQIDITQAAAEIRVLEAEDMSKLAAKDARRTRREYVKLTLFQTGLDQFFDADGNPDWTYDDPLAGKPNYSPASGPDGNLGGDEFPYAPPTEPADAERVAPVEAAR